MRDKYRLSKLEAILQERYISNKATNEKGKRRETMKHQEKKSNNEKDRHQSLSLIGL